MASAGSLMTTSIAGRLWPAKTSTSPSQTPGLSAAYMYMSKEPKSPLLWFPNPVSTLIGPSNPNHPCFGWFPNLHVVSTLIWPPAVSPHSSPHHWCWLLHEAKYVYVILLTLTLILLVIGFMHAYLGEECSLSWFTGDWLLHNMTP